MQASALPVFHPFTIKEWLKNYFTDKNHDLRRLELLEHSYCNSIETLNLFRDWYQQEYKPNLESSATQAEKSWVENLWNKIQDVLERKQNYSQTNLMTCFVNFHKKYPTPDMSDLLAKMPARGHCDGFAFLAGLSHILEHQPKSKNPRDDWTHVKKVYDTLLDWDKNKDGNAPLQLTQQQQQEIRGVFRLIFTAQQSRTKLRITQGDWEKIFLDTRGRKLLHPATYVLPYDEKGMATLVDKVLAADAKSQVQAATSGAQSPAASAAEMPDVELYANDAGVHATILIKLRYPKTGQIKNIFYDSNNLFDEMPVTDPAVLDKAMELAHFMDSRAKGLEVSPIVANVYALKPPANLIAQDALISDADIQAMTDVQRATMLNTVIRTHRDDRTLAERLLNKIVDVNILTNRGFNFLHVAAKYGRNDLLPMLLAKKTPFDIATIQSGRTPLHFAAFYGFDEVLEGLLKAGADPNIKTKDSAPKRAGWTALHMACARGHLECVKRLFGEDKDGKQFTRSDGSSIPKIDLEEKTKDGETAIFLAVQAEQWDIIPELIKRGANLLVNVRGSSLLGFATKELREYLAPHVALQAIAANDTLNLDKALNCMAGTNALLPMPNGKLVAPIFAAVDLADEKQDVQGAKFRLVLYCLYAKGADLNSQNQDGETPLVVLAKKQNVEFVKYMLEYADLSLKENRAALEAAKDNPAVQECIKAALLKHDLKQYRQTEMGKKKFRLREALGFFGKEHVPKRVKIADALLQEMDEKVPAKFTKQEEKLIQKEEKLRKLASDVRKKM